MSILLNFLQAGNLVFTLPIISIGIFLLFIFATNNWNSNIAYNLISYINPLGILALSIGLIGQIMGLQDMLGKISTLDSIPSILLINAIKVSFIPSLLGLIVFTLSKLATFFPSKEKSFIASQKNN